MTITWRFWSPRSLFCLHLKTFTAMKSPTSLQPRHFLINFVCKYHHCMWRNHSLQKSSNKSILSQEQNLKLRSFLMEQLLTIKYLRRYKYQLFPIQPKNDDPWNTLKVEKMGHRFLLDRVDSIRDGGLNSGWFVVTESRVISLECWCGEISTNIFTILSLARISCLFYFSELK